MYKVLNMGHRMEIYVDAADAHRGFGISRSFDIDVRIIGYTHAADHNELIIESDKGRFEYQ